ncbi:nucleoside recognition domain-containing protein [Halothermothrix orenii]|uniref:Nucleoside recognition domain protein n=1 Tax=Halothermothrix orenii (strain H 168 / OCM 544 / DSM 9562) TaxID=373903 RepID=B8CXB6_HALOH|nr:nucleoside recognition domain-containing protein [Halothermothrix orenii]ACL69935.1 nucleoside recognition domain protein [Halothermothrix orenii H 168]
MVNIIWSLLIFTGFMMAAFTGNMDKLTDAIFKGASESIDILIKLIGPMSLWLGIMNIAKKSGLVEQLGKLLKPIISYFFPGVPEEHPASGAIILNITANMLGLGNSATPLGIKAMQELQELNNYKSKASPAMCTLLALNTSSITLIPSTVVSLRTALGSTNPEIIVATTIFATTVSTITALILDKVFRIYTGGD